jgi:hypothetical protein
MLSTMVEVPDEASSGGDSGTGSTESGAEKSGFAHEATSGPAPGYNLVQDAAGSLTVEIPRSWGVLIGSDSEVGANWSDYGGENLASST